MRRTSFYTSVSSCALVAGALAVSSLPAVAACVTDASGNATCDGTVTTPLTVYDAAAKYQPLNGSNSYTPTSYNQNPPTVFVKIDPGATLAITTNSTSTLADRGIVAANYSNAENPAVNNVEVDNAGTVALTTAQIGSRVHAIVSDSQVNTFTVNNAATGTITATQNYFATFNSALLSTSSSGTPPTYSARYNGGSLNIVSALYSDDNTNSFVINNAGTITASGRYAAAYYGRADTTIVNTGTLGNLGWAPTDKIYDGHWAIGTYAGANFATVAGSSPDTPLYDVKNVATNAQGYQQGTLAVTDTSATTVTNKAGATITGDVLVLDTNPLVTAAALASGKSLPLAVSGSNSGPRDSSIENYGTINGNFYLGSGNHMIDNAAGATLNGSINVDQRASIGSFATGVPGTVAGTYQSAGPGTPSSTGAACPAAGTNTTDPYCAKTVNVLASFSGDRVFTLTNEGTLKGDITINDVAGATNTITLQGTGFSGNIVALNGVGTNSLTLQGVTNLASVRNFSSLDLERSNVAVANGVSLVDGATIKTTIFGRGGTAADPSTKLGSIQGSLTLAGDSTITPTFAAIVHNGDVYALASSVQSAGAISVKHSALVSFTPTTDSGALDLHAKVRSAAGFAGITTPGAQTIDGLTSYGGANGAVQALGAKVESLKSGAQVAAAGRALAPIVNGADIQIPINSVMLFHQQIDARLDDFIYTQIPASGRSADLGPARPVQVYGALPVNAGWIEGIGGGVHQGTRDGVTGYNADLTGVIGGYDRLVAPAFRVGAAFGFIDGNVNGNVNLVGQHEDIQTYQGLAYATYQGPRVYLRGSAGYGGVDFRDSRTIAFAGFNDLASGTHSGDIFTARGEGGVPVETWGGLVVPYGAFTYSRLSQNHYQEASSAGAGLGYASVTNDSDRSEVGGKVIVPIGGTPLLSHLFPVGSEAAIEGRAAYVHEFGDVDQAVSASFTGGNSFLVTGPNPSRDMLDYSVGLRVGSGPVQIDLSYNGLTRSTYLQQVGLLRLRYLF